MFIAPKLKLNRLRFYCVSVLAVFVPPRLMLSALTYFGDVFFFVEAYMSSFFFPCTILSPVRGVYAAYSC